MSRVTSFDSPVRKLMQVQIKLGDKTMTQDALVDSGADESLLDWELAKSLNLKVVLLDQPLEASALDGRLLCTVTHRTEPMVLVIDQEHREQISFHLFNSAQHPLILGYPWLVKHNPHVDWQTGKVKGWGVECSRSCLTSETGLSNRSSNFKQGSGNN